MPSYSEKVQIMILYKQFELGYVVFAKESFSESLFN